MGMQLALIITIFVRSTFGEDVQSVIDKVKVGVSAGQEILAIFNAGSTTKVIATIGKAVSQIAPFLGAFGSVLSLITVFIPKSPTPEMVKMTKEFARIDERFDNVFYHFEDVKNLIMKTSLRNQYGLYERRILWLSDKLQNLLNSDNATMRARKHLFLSAYNTVNNEPTMSLYRYVMEKGAISDNIPKVAMAYTHNHRRKVQDLLKGVLNLILQGAKIHLAYLKLKGFNYTYEQEERKWATRIKAVAKHIIDVDSEVKSKWKSQIENETLAIVRSQKGNDKTTVADAVYSHLSDKYDWRIWLVVIYNATKGPDKQWVQVCGGFYKFGFYGKNIVVASIDTNSTHPIDRHNIYTDLQRVKEVKRYWHWFIGWTTDPLPARSLFEKRLPKYITDPGCKRYPGIGVIIRSANPEYRSPSSHLVVSVKRHYNIHVFA